MAKSAATQSQQKEGGVTTGAPRASVTELASFQTINAKLSRGRKMAEALARQPSEADLWNTSNQVRMRMFSNNPTKILTTCRDLRGKMGFIDSWLLLKQSYVLDGFKIGGVGGRKLMEQFPAAPWDRLARDFALEYFTTSSVVTSWITEEMPVIYREGGNLARPLVQDTEMIEFDDAMGVEKVRPTSSRRIIGELKQQADAMLKRRLARGNGWITLGTDDEAEVGERFLVTTTGKRGCGYGMPGLYPLFFDLALLETLRLGDLNGAFSLKDVMRQIKVGHEITYGVAAGMSTHFLKPNDIAVINATLEKKVGLFDFVTRHDLGVSFPHLDVEFFDQKKHDPVWQRILEWAGPLMRALTAKAGEAGTLAMKAWKVEGEAHRRFIAEGLSAILNDPDFHRGAIGAQERVTVQFNPLTFLSIKEGREMLNFALSNGLCSPQTASELLGFDESWERTRLDEARQSPERYQPIFEPRQGLLAAGQEDPGAGRPPGNAAE